MYLYEQQSGRLYRAYELIGVGYAGHGVGKNNPRYQAVPFVGPITCGRWRIGKPYHHPRLGVLCFDLTPEPGTETFGRSEFRLHADSIHDPGNASEGCIVQSHDVRQSIADNLPVDDLLEVVPCLVVCDPEISV